MSETTDPTAGERCPDCVVTRTAFLPCDVHATTAPWDVPAEPDPAAGERVEQSVQDRCSRMREHVAQGLQIPCPDCYSVRVTAERIPWQPQVRWHPAEPDAGDGRDPKSCPKCGEWCSHDGWGHVHENGIGIESCSAEPDAGDVEALAWMIHRASGCGQMPTPGGGPGPVCEPDAEDFDAARAILASDWLDAVRRKAGHVRAEQIARATITGLHARWDELPGRLAPYIALQDVRQELDAARESR